DDNEHQAINAWPADDEEIDRVSETCALVPFELPSDDEDSEQAARNYVNDDVLQAVVTKLDALEQRQIEMNEEMKIMRQKLSEKSTASHHHHHTMPKHLSVELKGRIVGAYAFGIIPSTIAKKHNILLSTVLKVTKKWEKDGTVVPQKAPRPSILGELDVD
ncbi:hypothetical protein BGZ50_006595, partial [Haplosporangium sp. Z 11]